MLLRFGIKPCKVVLPLIRKDPMSNISQIRGNLKYEAFSSKYNTWYPAKLQDAKKAKKAKDNENCVYIHWCGWSHNYDEWVLPENFREKKV